MIVPRPRFHSVQGHVTPLTPVVDADAGFSAFSEADFTRRSPRSLYFQWYRWTIPIPERHCYFCPGMNTGMGWKSNSAHVRSVGTALDPQLRWLSTSERLSINLRLRTKFLLSLVLVIAGLTFATLAIVGHGAEEQVRKGIEQDTRNSVATFRNVHTERQIVLNREAEIMSTPPPVKT